MADRYEMTTRELPHKVAEVIAAAVVRHSPLTLVWLDADGKEVDAWYSMGGNPSTLIFRTVDEDPRSEAPTVVYRFWGRNGLTCTADVILTEFCAYWQGQIKKCSHCK